MGHRAEEIVAKVRQVDVLTDQSRRGEARLTADVTELACHCGRSGYSRIAKLLPRASC